MTYDGKGLTPIFHSEISSSHLLFDIFDKHKAVSAAFIKEYLGLEVEILQVFREKSYPTKGTIDLFITFNAKDRKCALLIEVKVHDYSSVTDYQIRTYYDAVLEDSIYDELYFIYLTQFNEKTDFDESVKPKSLVEAARGRELIGDHFHHLTWVDVHAFLERQRTKLSKEQLLMVDLHSSWVVEKGRADLARNAVETGERSLEDYLGDVSPPLAVLESLGKKESKKKTLNLIIDLIRLDDAKRDAVFKAIHDIVNSESVNKKKQFQTDEDTLKAAKDFLSELADNYEWDLLRFYAGLFHFTSETSFLRLNGIKDFSIKLEVIDKGEISLCRLRRNRRIEFYLKR
ncbi:MAG: PD-(D/E)XK nuclease family protein [Candidatus Thorarchaeota archaeon]